MHQSLLEAKHIITDSYHGLGNDAQSKCFFVNLKVFFRHSIEIWSGLLRDKVRAWLYESGLLRRVVRV